MSGTASFTLDFAEVAEEAYELIGLEARTGYDLVRARRSLNIMLTEWMSRGVNLWSLIHVHNPLKDTKDYYKQPAQPVLLDPADEDVVTAVLRRNGQDYPLQRVTRDDYMAIPNKAQRGRPTQIYVERGRQGGIYLWPSSDNRCDMLLTYRIRRLQTVDTNSGGIDVPALFYSALTMGLAFYLSMKAAPERSEMMQTLYEQAFERAANENTERGSLFISPVVC